MMATLEILEIKLKRRMRDAVERLDNREISRLNAMAENLIRARAALGSIEKGLHSSEDEPAAHDHPPDTSVPDWIVDDLDLETRPRAIQIEITAGDIRQRLLRLAKLRKAGFHLPEGRQLTVEAVASTGTTRFKTTVAEPPRLRARSEVAAFYKGAGVRSGDLILFEEVGPDTYRISKLPSPKPLDTEFLSSLQGTLSEWNGDIDDKAYGDL